MPIGSTSSCKDSVSPWSCTLDCTLVLCGTPVWRMWVLRMRVALVFACLCMQSLSRAHVEMKCKEKISTFHIAPMNSHVTNVFVYKLHITIFSRVYSHVVLCHSHVLVFPKIEKYERKFASDLRETWKNYASLASSYPTLETTLAL